MTLRGSGLDSTMPLTIDRLDALDAVERRRLLARAGAVPEEVLEAARQIIRDVRERGDAALREYTERYDGVRLSELEVRPDELEDALRAARPELRRALETALSNIRAFHAAHLVPQPDLAAEHFRVEPLGRRGVGRVPVDRLDPFHAKHRNPSLRAV